MLKSVAGKLGNTPAMGRKCYVNPVVIDAFLAGELQDLQLSNGAQGRARLLLLLTRTPAAPVLSAVRSRRRRSAQLDASVPEEKHNMPVEFTPVPDRGRVSPISWPAIFASLAVGISVTLLLTLAGVAVGIAVVEPGTDSPLAITIGAAAWQTASMLIAAIIGGYVAARLSGLRRTGDGVLHGAVSWGATTLLYAVLATTALGSLTAGMFGLLAPSSVERVASATGLNPDREQTQRALEGMGLTADQVRTITERLSAPGKAASEVPSSAATPQLEAAAGSVGTATGWLSATVLLTLVLSMVGGAFGTRGSRRVHHRRDQRETARPAVTETPASNIGSSDLTR